MLAMPGATIARSDADSSMPACAKTSLLPRLSGIQTTGNPRPSNARIAVPAWAAEIRCSAKLQTPTRPSRAASARPPIPPMPAIDDNGRGDGGGVLRPAGDLHGRPPELGARAVQGLDDQPDPPVPEWQRRHRVDSLAARDVLRSE